MPTQDRYRLSWVDYSVPNFRLTLNEFVVLLAILREVDEVDEGRLTIAALQ